MGTRVFKLSSPLNMFEISRNKTQQHYPIVAYSLLNARDSVTICVYCTHLPERLKGHAHAHTRPVSRSAYTWCNPHKMYSPKTATKYQLLKNQLFHRKLKCIKEIIVPNYPNTLKLHFWCHFQLPQHIKHSELNATRQIKSQNILAGYFS